MHGLLYQKQGERSRPGVLTGTDNRDSLQLDESTGRYGTKAHWRASQKTNGSVWLSVSSVYCRN